MDNILQTKSIGFLMGYLGRKARKYFEAQAQRLDIGTSGLFILKNVSENEGLTQNELSEKVKFDKAHIARGVKVLIKKSLIKTEDDLTDRRKKRLFFTEKGKELSFEVNKVFIDWNNILISDFSEEESALMRNMMLKMCKNTKEYFRNSNEQTNIS